MPYGHTTTSAQYNDAIQALGLTPDPVQAMNALVDHRLGRDVPPALRQRLGAVACQLSKSWLSVGANALLQSLVGKPVVAESGTPLVLVTAYAPELNDADLAALWVLTPKEMEQWGPEITHARKVGPVAIVNAECLPR